MKQTLFALATVGLLTGAASAQWAEVGDAPAGVPARQDTVGAGPLTSITGMIDRPNGDHTDTYSIVITDVAQFYATVKLAFGGSAISPTGSNVDTRLWLWDEFGNVLLGNDDVDLTGADADNFGSFISDPSTFTAFTGEVVDPTASGIALQAGQKYLLSISTFSQDPEDASLTDLVNLGSDFDALHGPNPNAGPFNAWEDFSDSDVMTYNIALQGATYCMIPAPGALALLGVAGVTGLRRRRRG